MAYKTIISPIAKANIKEIVAYYKKIASLKIAQNFLKDYEFTLRKIQRNPFFQIYYKDFRGLTLKKYPFIIFYQVDEHKKLILVKAVFNAMQDVGKRPS
ncbi:type II toxin-antitoxin system RelE/ParE family toxin [Chryseobacterium sp. GP-SGM7]|uniref:type II toxin-antitoxin system RelE/ParE family toxin n=1 Tax=Chryseobacterium sp. GP-SGM7 TaxID=3411323 RepID=UPI003B938C6C